MKILIMLVAAAALFATCRSAKHTKIGVIGGSDGPTSVYVVHREENADRGEGGEAPAEDDTAKYGEE